MNIKTRNYGDINIKEEDIIEFTSGMYGFEEYKKYIILKDEPEDDIMYLQSIDNEHLSFVLIDPYLAFSGYEPNVNDEDLMELKVNDELELKFLLVAIITKEIQQSLVNLKSPIAINLQFKIAKQVILENENYPLRLPLFKEKDDDKC